MQGQNQPRLQAAAPSASFLPGCFHGTSCYHTAPPHRCLKRREEGPNHSAVHLNFLGGSVIPAVQYSTSTHIGPLGTWVWLG